MFKKRKDTKKESILIEENSSTSEQQQATTVNEQPSQASSTQALDQQSNPVSNNIEVEEKEHEVNFVKPIVYKKPLSNQLSFIENEEEDDDETKANQKGNKKSKQKKGFSNMFKNLSADINYSNLTTKSSDFYQSNYDIEELRSESNKNNQKTLNLMEQLKQDQDNGMLDEEQLQDFDPSQYDEKVNTNIQEMEIEFSTQEKKIITNIKEQRSVSRNVITKDDYIKLCGEGDYNLSNNMDHKRMAMFGETNKYDKNKFEMEQEEISDEEFNEMEEAFVHNAMKQSNLVVDRDYTFKQKGSLQQMKRKKEETMLIANIDKIDLSNTIQLLESNHLTNFKIKREDDDKKNTISSVVTKCTTDINKWKEEIKALADQETAILQNLEFWREFNDMMNEKSKELKVAIKDNEKLNKRFLFANEKRLSSYTNSFLSEMNLPLIKRSHHGDDAVEDLYEMFPSNIRRSAIQEKKKLLAKQSSEHHTYLDGYSSDEDSDLPQEDDEESNNEEQANEINETKDFVDDKVALASAALGIMDEIEDYYKNFETYLEQSVQYCAIDDSMTLEDILFHCLKNEVQVELFAYDPLGRCSNQLKTDINSITVLSQINSQIQNDQSPHSELISKVKQRIFEIYVFDKVLQEIVYCYNPYSTKLTTQLQTTFLQLADISYISSKHKSKEVQTIFQKVITAVINKFEEYFTYTSQYPISSAAAPGQTKVNFEYLKFCLGRNLRLISNLINLRKMIPASAIYSLAFERILSASTAIISLFDNSQTRAFYLTKYILQMPVELIDRSEQIKAKVQQVASLLDAELEQVNQAVNNLSQSEVEQLEQIKQHLSQFSN